MQTKYLCVLIHIWIKGEVVNLFLAVCQHWHNILSSSLFDIMIFHNQCKLVSFSQSEEVFYRSHIKNKVAVRITWCPKLPDFTLFQCYADSSIRYKNNFGENYFLEYKTILIF